MDVRVTHGVVFGRAGVGHGTPAPRLRALLMDVYEPARAGAARRPALIPALKGEAPAGGSRSRMSRGLVVAQMALSIVLLRCCCWRAFFACGTSIRASIRITR